MKPFYVLLIVLAVGGAGWLVWSANGKSAPAQSPAAGVVLPASADTFKGYVLGSPSAPIEIVEYADFECPFCAQFATVQFPTIRDQLISSGKVRWRFRDFPLPPTTHRWSRLAAHAVACAAEQGKTWEEMDALFTHHDWAQRPADPTSLFRDLSKTVGLDVGRYDACMDSRRYMPRIEASVQEGESLGVQGTPTFFINGRMYQGRRIDSDAFAAIVDSVLKRAR